MSRAVLVLIALLLGVTQSGAAEAPLPNGPLFMGYLGSWAEFPVGTPDATRLANLPGSLDIVALGFVKPDLDYAGGADLGKTGLQMPYDGTLLKQAIALFKARHPKSKVLLAVGGSAYATLWGEFDPASLARLVAAVGADGIDLDYEPPALQCSREHPPGGETVICSSDSVWADLIRRVRAVLPRPAVLAVPGWSVAAYGVGAFASDPPQSRFTGSMLWLGRLPEAREIDVVSIMAYEAGPAFDPLRAAAAYRAVWPGRLLLGAMVPPDSSGGPDYSVASLMRYAAAEARDPLGGMMLYSLEAAPPGGATLAAPDGMLGAQTICKGLGRPDC